MHVDFGMRASEVAGSWSEGGSLGQDSGAAAASALDDFGQGC